MCAPMTMLHAPSCDKMAYRTVMMPHPHVAGMASHKCCPPKEILVIVCYRMHGDSDCDTMDGCMMMHADQAISGTTKYLDDGQARAFATAHAINLLNEENAHSGVIWERAGLRYQKPVFEAKADLRV
ncbi:hypothetical protein Acid345_3549 [Candidatus Koribacter versatilis Ellin345]|uniref:Uncharacterized protein n=2 Tax=Candidatus Korobacter versatilis TaxID=658062 RepID=Q1IKQ0_KORVE|nr:hypothetical protein Acid345_3549 [Candidatus Koribacter versatilis Ellin345]